MNSLDSLLNKPIYRYTINTRSNISAYGYTNCCFISSFHIQMKKHFNDFIDFKQLLKLLYKKPSNAYMNFALDFPKFWVILKTHMESIDVKWKTIFENTILRIVLPLVETSPLVKNQTCVLLAYIDINIINHEQVQSGNYDSLEKSFSYNDDDKHGKTIIDIIQFSNHFEPVELLDINQVLTDIKMVSNKTFLTN